jgi:hypothetical protein
MREVCRAADREVVAAVESRAASGELSNFVAGAYGSYGKVDVLAYKEPNISTLVPGASVRAKIAPHMLGAPQLVKGLDFLCKPVGTVEARVPRGYLIPAELGLLAEKLRILGVKVETLARPVKASGEEFVVDKVVRGRSGGLALVKLEGGFAPSPQKEFPAGTYRVDLAQPLANLAFYCLEPQAADGFAGWGVLDDWFKAAGADLRSVVYPVYKYAKIAE